MIKLVHIDVQVSSDVIATAMGAFGFVHISDHIVLRLPDRTPRDKLEAVAKAINDALAAAREIDGAGRD